MTYIILKQPHPLDAIWEQAVEAVSNAQYAVDSQPDDFTNADNDRLNEALLEAIAVVIALPARHVSDSLYKLDLSGLSDEGELVGIDQRAIFQEGLTLMDAALLRGDKLMKQIPDLLEGVTL